MGDLFRKVLPLAVGGAISPSALTVAVLTLSSSKRPVARGVAYALGFVTVLVVFTVVGLAFLGRVTDDPAHRTSAVTETVDVLVGVFLLLLAVRAIVRKRTGDDGDVQKPPREHKVGLTASFITGMALMLTNVTTIVLYIPAMKDIDKSDVSTSSKAVVVIVAVLITSLPVTTPLLIRVVAPGPSVRLLTELNAFIARHEHSIIVGVEVVFGAYLLAKGFGL
jgi:threonine/homoserine/homoserine lactone efflux protein